MLWTYRIKVKQLFTIAPVLCPGAPGQELPSWGYRGHEEAERRLPEADQGRGQGWAGAACGPTRERRSEAAQSYFSEDSRVRLFKLENVHKQYNLNINLKNIVG